MAAYVQYVKSCSLETLERGTVLSLSNKRAYQNSTLER
jgi:hypothetical protein